MKKRFIIFLFLIYFIPSMVFALVTPSNLLYVTDEADILETETEEFIVKYSDFLQQKKKIRYYVVTIPSLENYELETYINYVTKNFSMGDKSVLIFFTKEEKTIQVVLGPDLSHIMKEEEIENYIKEYSMPYFQNGEWDKGIKNGYTAFYKRICTYYQIDASSMELSSGKEFTTKYRYPLIIGLVFVGMMLGYNLCTFFKKLFRRKISSSFDIILFSVTILCNITLLAFAYYIEPWILVVILAVEFLAISSVFSNSSNMTLEEALRKVRMEERKKEKRQRKRKKTRKKVKK